MNYLNAKNITPETTDNLIFLRKKINKIFYISKIKKYNEPKITLFKPDTQIIRNSKELICKEISFCFCKAQNEENNINENSKKSIEFINRENKKNIFNLTEKNKNRKNQDKIKLSKFERQQKHLKKNSLIRPILVGESQKEENNLKKNENIINPVNINIKNSFKANSIINNFIINDFPKNLFSINNNFKFQTTNNFMKIPLNKFEFMPPLSDDNFKNYETKFHINSNNENITNYPRINMDILKKKEKFSISLGNSSSKDTSLDKNKFIFLNSKKRKGRKSKNLKYFNIPSKHTKFSPDNMMRKIKNKVIESSRLLINKVLADEIRNLKDLYQFPYNEFKKIKGAFSQELNIKYNLWFYQIPIKEILSMEISSKYSLFEKSSNKELIEYIFSKDNANNFCKAKQLLNMPFHQYYHDIFLSENKDWDKYFDVKSEENKYELNYLLKSLEEEDKNINLNKIYIEKINNLAKNYEDFFLLKKMRNIEIGDKKNDFIKSFMNNTLQNDYLKYCEAVKQIKQFYDDRKSNTNEINTHNIIDKNAGKEIIIEQQNDSKEDDILKNIIISIDGEKNQFLGKKRNPLILQNYK